MSVVLADACTVASSPCASSGKGAGTPIVQKRKRRLGDFPKVTLNRVDLRCYFPNPVWDTGEVGEPWPRLLMSDVHLQSVPPKLVAFEAGLVAAPFSHLWP